MEDILVFIDITMHNTCCSHSTEQHVKTAHILTNQGHVSSFSVLSLSTQSNGGAENQNTMKTLAQDCSFLHSIHLCQCQEVSGSVKFQCHSVKGLVQATMTMTKPIFLVDTAD